MINLKKTIMSFKHYYFYKLLLKSSLNLTTSRSSNSYSTRNSFTSISRSLISTSIFKYTIMYCSKVAPAPNDLPVETVLLVGKAVSTAVAEVIFAHLILATPPLFKLRVVLTIVAVVPEFLQKSYILYIQYNHFYLHIDLWQ